MSKIIVYTSSVSSSTARKKAQEDIKALLTGKKIDFEEVDIAADTALREAMREKIKDCGGEPGALPPQLFKGDTHLGNYEAFKMAVEDEEIMKFLKMDAGDQQQSQ